MISNVETAGSTVIRQKTLKEQYFFSCACPRCSKLGQADDIQESNKGFICQHCGLLRDTDEIRTVTDIKLITEKASKSLSSGNLYDAASLYKQVERLQIRSYHPFSIILMRTRESLLKIFMELQD
ncbi:histone modifying enzyme [Lithospermum erythrorhizon]|uniref:Histone modifying enzyme n=1 Tax=Lithospermum erythrorhizon TaxID=34254 RepID=A0AAV3P014_LITER